MRKLMSYIPIITLVSLVLVVLFNKLYIDAKTVTKITTYIAHIDKKEQITRKTTTFLPIGKTMIPQTQKYTESIITFTIQNEEKTKVKKSVSLDVYNAYSENKDYIVDVYTDYINNDLNNPIGVDIKLTVNPIEPTNEEKESYK